VILVHRDETVIVILVNKHVDRIRLEYFVLLNFTELYFTLTNMVVFIFKLLSSSPFC